MEHLLHRFPGDVRLFILLVVHQQYVIEVMVPKLKTLYGVREIKRLFVVAGKDLAVFRAPQLFTASDIRHTLRRCDDIFDRLKVAYYTERLRDEWYEVWDAAFAA